MKSLSRRELRNSPYNPLTIPDKIECQSTKGLFPGLCALASLLWRRTCYSFRIISRVSGDNLGNTVVWIRRWWYTVRVHRRIRSGRPDFSGEDIRCRVPNTNGRGNPRGFFANDFKIDERELYSSIARRNRKRSPRDRKGNGSSIWRVEHDSAVTDLRGGSYVRLWPTGIVRQFTACSLFRGVVVCTR